jgi:signal transduction histidine kinase/CheY-like chemotaxis protein
MHSRRILIVDSDKTTREILTAFLSKMDCEPLDARSAEEALLLLDGTNIAVVLAELVLPEMDGFRFLGRVRQVSPETEIVLMTGETSVETAVRAIRMGAYDYLRKPVSDLDEIWTTVQRALEKSDLSFRNRRLLSDLEARNRELSAAVKRLTSLIEAGRAMSGIESVSDLLDFFVGLVASELDSDRASLMLLDEKGNEMVIVASRGISDEVVRTVRVKIGEGIAGWVARAGKPVVVKDAREDPRFRNLRIPYLTGSFISSPVVLSIPIKAQERVLGVINVTRKRSGGHFTDEDMAYVYGLAGQAAVALERAKHLQDLQAACESLKSTRDQLVISERLKALGQMAGGIAHDINNILAGVLGTAQLLSAKLAGPGAEPEEVRSGLEGIEKAVLAGAETVRRIQDFTRIRKDLPGEAADINRVVRDAIEMTRPKWKSECRARGIAVDVRHEAGDIPVTAGNARELTQVVGSLIFNAVEAMPEGGAVTLRTYRDGGWIRLEVTDTGHGMSREVQARLFEPFFSTKEESRGMGLSIVYGVISRYGGNIAVTSEEGKGATFTVSLPVLPVRTLRRRRKSARPGAGPFPARILLVEDNELNRRLFQEALSLAGHEVSTAATGSDGLSLFARGAFDLVITDLTMPGISGWEVARGVKRSRPDVPVILLSGWSVHQEEAEVKAAGVDHVIPKPCSLETLRDTVKTALLGAP